MCAFYGRYLYLIRYPKDIFTTINTLLSPSPTKKRITFIKLMIIEEDLFVCLQGRVLILLKIFKIYSLCCVIQ